MTLRKDRIATCTVGAAPASTGAESAARHAVQVASIGRLGAAAQPVAPLAPALAAVARGGGGSRTKAEASRAESRSAPVIRRTRARHAARATLQRATLRRNTHNVATHDVTARNNTACTLPHAARWMAAVVGERGGSRCSLAMGWSVGMTLSLSLSAARHSPHGRACIQRGAI
jgi:hypothetical protein